MNQWQLRTFERIQVARYRIKGNVMLHFYTLLLRFERCTSSKRGKGRKSRCIDLWSVIWNSAAVSYVAQVYMVVHVQRQYRRYYACTCS